MNSMSLLVQKARNEARSSQLGMILCHNGVVCGTSRNGANVAHLHVEKKTDQWDSILASARIKPGIASVQAHLFSGRREVGEDVMIVVVAGDIRENVFPVLQETVDLLKKDGVSKREVLMQE